jgi:hypothetical protein
MGRKWSMFDPTEGRWTTQDPLGLEPDSNPYRYVGNDPINNSDPSGLKPRGRMGAPVFRVYTNPFIPRVVEAKNLGEYIPYPLYIRCNTTFSVTNGDKATYQFTLVMYLEDTDSGKYIWGHYLKFLDMTDKVAPKKISMPLNWEIKEGKYTLYTIIFAEDTAKPRGVINQASEIPKFLKQAGPGVVFKKSYPLIIKAPKTDAKPGICLSTEAAVFGLIQEEQPEVQSRDH